MNRKQFRGTVRSAIGELQWMTGKLVGNWDLQRRGLARKIAGKTEKLAGNALATIQSALRRH